MPEITIEGFDEVAVGFKYFDPGEYTVNVTEKPTIETNDNGKTFIALTMKILEGPQQQEVHPETGSKDPRGGTIKDRLYLVDKAYFRVKQLLVAAGILTRDDKTSPIAKGKFSTDILMGTRFTIKYDVSMRDGKEYRETTYVI